MAIALGDEPNMTVESWLQREGALAPELALPVVRQAAERVSQLHGARNRIHGSIEPRYLLFDEQRQIRLLGPGLRGEFDDTTVELESIPPELQELNIVTLPVGFDELRSLLTEAQVAMEPQRVDIYQLGALLCRLVSGESVSAFLFRPQTKARIPPAVQSLIERSLGHEPQQRMLTVREFIQASDQALQQVRSDTGDSSKVAHPLDRVALDDGTKLATADETTLQGGAGAPEIASPMVVATSSTPGDPPSGRAASALIVGNRDSATDIPFQRLGHFEILQRLGHGGMGDVYKGYEPALDRYVAIKVLPGEFARHPDFVRRFRSEATAVARLTHPNVVQIHFIGEDQGHHFFAMQFVDGESLAELLARRNRLSPDDSLAIIQQVLLGLAAAHREGIIHRDIKPGNILLDRAHGRALLADFGLVKRLEQGDRTATGMVVGSVDYISPEQGRGHAVDARSDLYSVGVVLYEMLCGRLPFESDSPTGMIFQHVYEPPQPLSDRIGDLPPSLCAIVHKLLAKSPDQRYASASETLAELQSIRESLRSLPPGQSRVERQSVIIQAPSFDPPPVTDLLDREVPVKWWRWLRQQLLDVLGQYRPELVERLQNTQQQVDGALSEYDRRRTKLQRLVSEAESILHQLEQNAEEHHQAAVAAQRRAEGSVAAADAEAALREKDEAIRNAAELAGPIRDQQGQLESMQLKLATVNATLARIRSQRDLLDARLKTARARIDLATRQPRRRVVRMVALWGAFAMVAAAGITACVVFWRSQRSPAEVAPVATNFSPQQIRYEIGEAGELIIPFQIQPTCFAIAPGRTDVPILSFATGNADGTISLYQNPFARDQKAAAHHLPRKLSGHIQTINGLAYSANGEFLASASDDNSICIWATANPGQAALRRLEGHRAPVSSVLFAADGKQVLSADRSGSFRLWDTMSGSEIRSSHVDTLRTSITSMDWSRDASFVLFGARLHGEQSMGLWNLYADREGIVFDTNKKATSVVALSHSQQEAFSLHDGLIHVQNVRTGETIRQFGGSSLRAASFAPDSHRAWTADALNSLTLWDVRTGTAIETYRGHTKLIKVVAISADGSHGISASDDGTIRVWDLPPTPPPANQVSVLSQRGKITNAVFSPDGFSLLAISDEGLNLWNLDDGSRTFSLGKKSGLGSAAFSSDGGYLLYSAEAGKTERGMMGLRKVTDRGPIDFRQFEGHTGQVTCVALSSDMQRAVSGSLDGSVRVWNAATAQETDRLDVSAPVNAVACSRSGDEIFIAANDNAVRAWKPGTKAVRQLEGHTFHVFSVALSADGNRLASASGDRTVGVWDVQTGKLLTRLTGHSGRVNGVAISEHGLTVVSGSDDGTVRVWDVVAVKEILQFDGHTGPVRTVSLSRDGTRVASGGDDSSLRLWKLPILLQ